MIEHQMHRTFVLAFLRFASDSGSNVALTDVTEQEPGVTSMTFAFAHPPIDRRDNAYYEMGTVEVTVRAHYTPRPAA